MASYNPYAAPAAAPYAPYAHPPPPPAGEPEPWDVGEVVRIGWNAYKGTWAPLTFGFFVTALLGMIPGQIVPALTVAGRVTQGSHLYWELHAPLSFLGWVIGEFVGAGFTKAALSATRTSRASFAEFFSGPRFVSYLGMSFLKALAIGLGFALLVVPGVILALGFANAPFYVVDQNLGPVASLKASWESTEGQKGQLFVLSLAELGLILAGLAACCLGTCVAVPVMALARAVVYMRMSGTTVRAAT